VEGAQRAGRRVTRALSAVQQQQAWDSSRRAEAPAAAAAAGHGRHGIHVAPLYYELSSSSSSDDELQPATTSRHVSERIVSHPHTHTHTHTHPFNSPLSGTIRVSRYQKGETSLGFTEARDSEWQWHQLDYMQICTSLQTDNHASTTPLSFYRPDALPAAQPTASNHGRHPHYAAKSIPKLLNDPGFMLSTVSGINSRLLSVNLVPISQIPTHLFQ